MTPQKKFDVSKLKPNQRWRLQYTYPGCQNDSFEFVLNHKTAGMQYFSHWSIKECTNAQITIASDSWWNADHVDWVMILLCSDVTL